MSKLRWAKYENELVLVDFNDLNLASVVFLNGGWYFEGEYFSSLQNAKNNVISALEERGEL